MKSLPKPGHIVASSWAFWQSTPLSSPCHCSTRSQRSVWAWSPATMKAPSLKPRFAASVFLQAQSMATSYVVCAAPSIACAPVLPSSTSTGTKTDSNPGPSSRSWRNLIANAIHWRKPRSTSVQPTRPERHCSVNFFPMNRRQSSIGVRN